MSQRKLRDEIRDHYQQQELPPESLARLVAMAESEGEVAAPDVRGRRAALAAFAASVLVILVTAWLWPGSDHRSAATARLAGAVAEEVALNHTKELGVEFAGSDYDTLRNTMDKLDFSLVAARKLEGRDLRLVGGRYCSIQGNLAAQLRLETPTGKTVTLYQTPLVEKLSKLPPRELQLRGLRIDFWQQDGVLLAMARTP